MFFNVVEYLDPTGEVMVARIPPSGSGDFTTGSQLIVQENQVAVFYRDGQMADQFKAGRYTLSTQNLPILKTLTKIVFKGKSPFRAYVYFVNLKMFIDLGWGTPNRILYRDATFKMGVNLGAFGTWSVRITDHVRFLNTIVGTQGMQDTPAIEEFLRKIIASRFAGVLAKTQTSVYDLPSRYDTLGAELKDATRPEFSQYGLELVDIAVVNISLPDEVMQRIDERSRLDMYDKDDIAKAQGLAIADALPEAAANPGGAAGAGVGAGMGIGAGLGFGQVIANNLGQNIAGAQQGAAIPPTPPPPVLQWYAYINGSQVGPMTPGQLSAAVQSGQVTGETLLWRQGMANWTTAAGVPDLASIFRSPPPPPVAPPGGS
ncbi:MAG: SPFH domain-containing protein [Sedimentisphaerales bacterium]|nr:SPFH domain-containing protein [Sedimentisphaerales bacterium]